MKYIRTFEENKPKDLILFELPFSRLYYLLSRNQIPYYVIGIINYFLITPFCVVE